MTGPQHTLTNEVIEVYQKYVHAFMSDDMDTINALVSFPLAYIGEGMVTMLNDVRPSALKAQIGWHKTLHLKYEVVGISETKAHLILRSGTRVRQDGSPIEDVYAFYAWTKTAEGWKMFAISDVRVPA